MRHVYRDILDAPKFSIGDTVTVSSQTDPLYSHVGTVDAVKLDTASGTYAYLVVLEASGSSLWLYEHAIRSEQS